jgi:hypothetical protein
VIPVIALLLLPSTPATMQQVETPRTVNGQALGTVVEFQNRGPGRVCLENAAFDMNEGEAATLQYAGIHSATLVVTSPEGNLWIRHGDHWARKSSRLSTIWQNGDRAIRRKGRGKKATYYYYAATEYSDGESVLVLIVDGTALTGSDKDLPRLNRLTLQPKRAENCLRQYTYGWDMLLGDEPLSTGEKE